jgi:hypothetical protein
LAETKPAALARQPESISKQSQSQQQPHGLDSEPQSARQLNFSPADARRPPDDRGESDLVFFTRRPGAVTRTRLPFPAELPIEVWQAAVDAGLAGFVIVTRAPGSPWVRSRKFVFTAGGTA